MQPMWGICSLRGRCLILLPPEFFDHINWKKPPPRFGAFNDYIVFVKVHGAYFFRYGTCSRGCWGICLDGVVKIEGSSQCSTCKRLVCWCACRCVVWASGKGQSETNKYNAVQYHDVSFHWNNLSWNTTRLQRYLMIGNFGERGTLGLDYGNPASTSVFCPRHSLCFLLWEMMGPKRWFFIEDDRGKVSSNPRQW